MKTTAETGSARPIDPEHFRYWPDCPRCKGLVYRIHRRFADRVLSMFVLVHRYRCSSWACGWEGLLQATDDLLPGGGDEPAYDGSDRVPEPSRRGPLMPSEKLPR